MPSGRSSEYHSGRGNGERRNARDGRHKITTHADRSRSPSRSSRPTEKHKTPATSDVASNVITSNERSQLLELMRQMQHELMHSREERKAMQQLRTSRTMTPSSEATAESAAVNIALDQELGIDSTKYPSLEEETNAPAKKIEASCQIPRESNDTDQDQNIGNTPKPKENENEPNAERTESQSHPYVTQTSEHKWVMILGLCTDQQIDQIAALLQPAKYRAWDLEMLTTDIREQQDENEAGEDI